MEYPWIYEDGRPTVPVMASMVYEDKILRAHEASPPLAMQTEQADKGGENP